VARLPQAINVLAERILTEEQVVRLIALERDPRNHALLRLLTLRRCGYRRPARCAGRRAGRAEVPAR
jgi:hypothetical protein